MPMKRCEANLHFYDMEKYKTCPYCEGQKVDKRPAPRTQEKSEDSQSRLSPTVLVDSDDQRPTSVSDASQDGPMDGQLTKEAAPAAPHPEKSPPPAPEPASEPGARRRIPRSSSEFPVSPEQSAAEAAAAEGPGSTAVHDGMTLVVFNPVVGWLVCTDGPDMGHDYHIKAGINEIGREADPEVDIVIRGDNLISPRYHAEIQYDPEENVFYLIQKKNEAVMINGVKVKRPTRLNPYDTIQLGDTSLLFVPLCSDKFQWPMFR